MSSKIQVQVNGSTYHIVLKDCYLAKKVESMLPFTYNGARGLEQEYYDELPQKVDKIDIPPTFDGHKNFIYYFEPWNTLSMLFNDANTSPYEIFHIGDFEEDISDMLKKQGSHLTFTFKSA